MKDGSRSEGTSEVLPKYVNFIASGHKASSSRGSIYYDRNLTLHLFHSAQHNHHPTSRCQYVPSPEFKVSNYLHYPNSSLPSHPQPHNPKADTPHQAYNSIFNADSHPPTATNIGNFPLLPLRTKVRGPAYTLPLSNLPANISPEPDDESYDCLDEVLGLFRANTFFRNFEIQGPADRLLIYGILWVSECLGKIRSGMSAR